MAVKQTPAVGVITIGQAPRADFGPVFLRHAEGTGIEIIERGALDGLTLEEIERDLTPVGSEVDYVTKLTSGDSVRIAKARLLPLLHKRIDELDAVCDEIVIACTGDFPTLREHAKLRFADQLLVEAVRDRGNCESIGLVVPLESQTEHIVAKWLLPGLTVHTAVATPYGPSDLSGAVAELVAQGSQLVVLDCMGFTQAHRESALESAGEVEVLVPQEIIPEVVIGRLAGRVRPGAGGV